MKPPTAAHAQEVSVPDASLDAAIRDALQKPSGPLTQQDLLSLTNLQARARGIRSLEGLEAAANLTVLDLRSNSLSAVIVPSGLTKLATLDLGQNPLANCTIPESLTNLQRVLMEAAALTDLTLPPNLTMLTELSLPRNRFNARNASMPSGRLCMSSRGESILLRDEEGYPAAAF